MYIGSMKLCELCIIIKAKQNNFSKNSDHDPYKVNAEQIFIYIPTVKWKRYGPPVQSKQYCLIVLDEQTKLKFNKLLLTKNGMIEPTLEQIDKWKMN